MMIMICAARISIVTSLIALGCNDMRTDRHLNASVITSVQVELSRKVESVIATPLKGADLDNSEIRLYSSAIDNALSAGADIIPIALQRMQDPDMDLNSLMKLFSLCDQVLRRVGGPPAPYNFGIVQYHDGRIISFSTDPTELREDARATLSSGVRLAYETYLANSI